MTEVMDELTSPPGLVALGAAAGALLAIVCVLVLFARTRSLRRAQSAVLGDGNRDLVGHAERLQVAFTELRDWVEEAMSSLDHRTGDIETRLDGCLAYHAVIRYDAYGEMSGRQSSSVALLDSRRSGIVVSSIVHREQARVYVKQLRDGESEIDLSPEELEAVETALNPAHA